MKTSANVALVVVSCSVMMLAQNPIPRTPAARPAQPLARAAVAPAEAPATLVAPGVVSTGAYEGPFALTPDGQHLYFTRFVPGTGRPRFFVSRLHDGRWGEPARATMPEGIVAAPFSFSPDGTRLYFTHAGERPQDPSRLWVAERDGNGWKNPRSVGGALDAWDGDQVSPSAAADGTLYFSGKPRQSRAGWDLYRAALKSGQYAEPELVGAAHHARVNTPHDETSVTVSADGSVLVFSSTRSPNGVGGSDLYLGELPTGEGSVEWSWNLGRLVNTGYDEEDPRLSADGTRLYFCRGGDLYEIDLARARRAPAASAAWKPRKEMPMAREWPQLAALGGRIYVYGGDTGGPTTGQPRRWANEVDVYDPATDTWSSAAPAPDGWKQGSLFAIGDRLFLHRRGDQAAGIAEYDAAANRWHVRPGSDVKASFALPLVPPFWMRTIVLGRRAYTLAIAGGFREHSFFAAFDPDAGAWSARRSLPYSAPQLAAWRGRLYAFGGGGERTRVGVYDPAADQWTEAAPMNMARWESAVVTVGDEIWLIGGHGVRSDEPMDGDVTPTVLRFDPARNRWLDGPPLPWQRAASTAVVVNGRLFVMGGLRMGPRFSQDSTVLEYTGGQRR